MMFMMSMKLSPKIVTFMAPGSGFQALGWNLYGYLFKCILIIKKKFFYSPPIYTSILEKEIVDLQKFLYQNFEIHVR